MMTSLLTYLLLTAAEPAAPAQAAAAPAGAPIAALSAGCDSASTKRMAITEQGVPVEKKDKKKGKRQHKPGTGTSQSDSSRAAQACPSPASARMAIDELGMPIDKKDKKGKVVVTGGQDCDDGAAACRPASCPANAKLIVDTYGGHGAHGETPIAISESGVHVAPQETKAAIDPASSSSSAAIGQGCPAPAGMAINEKGTRGKPTPKTSPK